MYKPKFKNLTSYIIPLTLAIIFLVFIVVRINILDIFRIPLIIGSSILYETKSILTYKFIEFENFKLKQELDSLKKDSVLLNELELENERLRKLLSLKQKLQFNTQAASVIARDPNNWSSGILIDSGKRQGVKAGDIVITDLGLVGRIIDTQKDTSRVVLINDPNNSVAGIIQRSSEEGIVSGTLLGALRMRYLDPDSDCVPGDIVVTSGLSGNYPKGILIGKIESVEVQGRSFSKVCLLEPAVDLSAVKEVLVIISK